MVKWVGVDPPFFFIWKSLISKVVTLERSGHYISGRLHTFKQKRNILKLNTI